MSVTDRAAAIAGTNVSVVPHLNRDDGRTTIETVQDMEPHLDYTKMLQGIEHNRKANFRHGHHIPLIWLEKWLNEAWDRGYRITNIYGKQFWEEIVIPKLKDPQYKFLQAGPTGTAYKQGFKF